MNESLQIENFCPNCGKNLKLNQKFCESCGINLDQYKKQKLEIICPNCEMINKPDTKFCVYCGINYEQYEPNKVVISENFRKQRKNVLIGSLILALLLSIVASILTMTWGDPSRVGLAIIITIGLISLLCTFPLLLSYGIIHAHESRMFTISEKKIGFFLPRQQPFQIDWNEINSIQVKRKSGYYIKYNIYKFFTNKSTPRTFSLKVGLDFRKKTCNEIRTLISKYANKLNKLYEYKKSFWY